jgi:hypothetical protein
MKKILFVLIVGGLSFTAHAQAWTKLNSMPTRLTFPVVGVIGESIHVVGGGGVNGATDLHLRYTPVTDTWDTLAPVPYLAQQPGGGVVNGKLHFLGGGYPNSGTRLDKHYVYDPGNNTWTKLANVPIPRVIHKTAVLGDSIYVLSGQPDKKRVDVYNAVNDTWIKYNDLPDNNFWYAGITTYSDKIYRFGGGGSISATNAAHFYDPSTDSWGALSTLPKGIHAPDAQTLGDSIYITGGYSSGSYLSGVWIYDIANDTYSAGPWLNSERSYHNLVRVEDCLYSIGGNNNTTADSTAVSVLRYCRGDNFASSTGQQLSKVDLALTQSINTVYVTSKNKTDDIIFEVYNMVGVKIFEKTFSSTVSKLSVDKEVIANIQGHYVVVVNQGNFMAQTKILIH